jgi:hypothetical protein
VKDGLECNIVVILIGGAFCRCISELLLLLSAVVGQVAV